MLNIIIFPTNFHLEYIKKNAAALAGKICILYTGPRPSLHNIQCIHEEEFDISMAGEGTGMLPCTEAALYFMWRHKCFEKIHTKQFSDGCYGLFLKNVLQTALQKAGIAYLPKTPITNNNLHSLSFPIIVKPNFGFASQLVTQQKTAEALEAHLHHFKEAYRQSIVEQFRLKYLSDLDENECMQALAEDDRTDLSFTSVPFIVENNAVRAFFPTIGNGTLISTHLTEHRVVFKYPLKEAAIDTTAVKNILERLHHFFELKDGVYHSEFLCGPGETYLVEFSPRLTGEAIARMISYAEGIDLAGLSISLFMGENMPYNSQPAEKELELLRIYTQRTSDLESQLPPKEKRLLTLSKVRPESVSVDIICTT